MSWVIWTSTKEASEWERIFISLQDLFQGVVTMTPNFLFLQFLSRQCGLKETKIVSEKKFP